MGQDRKTGDGVTQARASSFECRSHFCLHFCGVFRMEPKLHVGNALGVSGGTEDLALVVLQRFDPASDVACMGRNVGRDADFDCDECLSKFGAQLFHGICG